MRLLNILYDLLFGWWPECEICKAEGYPGQIGHSTISCEADRLGDTDEID